MHHREEFLPDHRIFPETSQHATGDQIGALLINATSGHAMVGRLDYHANALRLQHVFDRVGDLSGHTLLDLKPLGIGLDYARQLGDADDTRIWHIGDPSTADDWRD